MRRYLSAALVSIAILSFLSGLQAQELRTSPLPTTTLPPALIVPNRTGAQLSSSALSPEMLDAQVRRDRREQVQLLYRSTDWYDGPSPAAFLYGKRHSPYEELPGEARLGPYSISRTRMYDPFAYVGGYPTYPRVIFAQVR